MVSSTNSSLSHASSDAREIISRIPITELSPGERHSIDETLSLYEMANSGLEKIHALEQLIKQITRKATNSERWLTTIATDLCTHLSTEIIEYTSKHTENKKQITEDAASVISQLFRITVSDYHTETPFKGRTMECHRVACILLRMYVRIDAFPLAEGILKAIKQYQQYIPPLSSTNWQTQVQFSYYEGVLQFRDLNFKAAADLFANAVCASISKKDEMEMRLNGAQLTQIMRLYIPSQYIAYNRAPTNELMQQVPNLKLFPTIIKYSRQGNLSALENAVKINAQFLKQQRVYLAFKCCLIPRARLNLLRRVWLILGKPKRIPISEFSAALKLSKELNNSIDAAEFYCTQFVANGEVRGYVHHELKLLLVSSTQPFPTLVQANKK